MPLDLPVVDYRPRDPISYRPAIGLIGCGGITSYHLGAYRAAGYRIVALFDVSTEAAEKSRAAYYPEAAVYSVADELLSREDIEVVDIATHPAQRSELIEKARQAGIPLRGLNEYRAQAPCPQALVLGFAGLQDERLEGAVRALRKIWEV